MRMTEHRLRLMIREYVLNELFESQPYDYSYDPDNSSVILKGTQSSLPWKVLHQDAIYNFTSEENEYEVVFQLNPSNRKISIENLENPQDPKHYYWDISYTTGFSEFEMTNVNDMRVLPTIGKITADFFKNMLPTLLDSDVNNFGFVGINEVGEDPKKQSKRTRVYLGMLSRYIKSHNLKLEFLPSDPTQLDVVRFKVSS